MKFMMIVKASKESEAGIMPSETLLSAMGTSVKNIFTSINSALTTA